MKTYKVVHLSEREIHKLFTLGGIPETRKHRLQYFAKHNPDRVDSFGSIEERLEYIKRNHSYYEPSKYLKAFSI